MWLHETSLFAIKIIDFPVFNESVTDGPTDGRTDGPTDRRTDRPSYRDARTHLKIWIIGAMKLKCLPGVKVSFIRLKNKIRIKQKYTCAQGLLYFTSISAWPRLAKPQMLHTPPMTKNQAMWATKFSVFLRIARWVEWDGSKNTFLDKFLPTACFYTLIFPDFTHFCACFLKIGIKIELLAQPASFLANFVTKSNIGWLKISH